jgi:hypothetical protein
MTKNDLLDVWATNLRCEIASLLHDGYSQADAMQWVLSWARRNASECPYARYVLSRNQEDYGTNR